MAPKYKLTYFNLTGRGEFARLVFAAAGVEYEDVRIKFEDFPKLQPSLPFSQLPILEFDGEVMSQSMVIASYLAREFGLAGANNVESAKCDMISACVVDMIVPVDAIWQEQDEEAKATLMKKYAEKLPDFIKNFEKNIGDNGHFVGDKLTWADIAFYSGSFWPGYFKIDLDLSGAPKLRKCIANVEANPGIAAWLKVRPEDKL